MSVIEVVRTLVTQCSHVMHSDTGFGEKGFDTKVTDESLVFCCYQQVHHIFNMSCPRVILQVRSHDGMSAPQNVAAAVHTHSLMYHIFARVVSSCLPCSLHLPEFPSPMVGPP